MADAPLGIFGGTFDPVHAAHLRIALLALNVLRVERVLWVPTGAPSYYREAPAAAAGERVAMLQRALADEPRYVIDLRELAPQASGYTVDTLTALRAEHGRARPLVLLMGADQFAKLDRWHRWRDLFALAHLAVFARPGWLPEANAVVSAELAARAARPEGEWRERPAGAVVRVELAPLNVSGTDIRARIARGESVADLLPRPVLEYIDSHRLYRAR